MILSISQAHLNEAIEHELQFHQYLQIFNCSLPILPSKLLVPLTQTQAFDHFEQLQKLVNAHQQHIIDIEQLLSQASLSPSLEPLLSLYQKGSLAPYHLFELTQFVANELCMLVKEQTMTDYSSSTNLLKTILSLLDTFTEEGGAHLCLPDQAKEYQQQIHGQQDHWEKEIILYQEDIFRQTGRRFNYPYPQEFKNDDEVLDSLKKCPHLILKTNGNLITVCYNLSEKLISIDKAKELAKQNYKELVNRFMDSVNRQLTPHVLAFTEYYQWRKDQVFKYALCLAVIKQNLTIPQFTEKKGLTLIDGRLPILAQEREHRYIPLSIELYPGPNLLYGANMAGKTSVIKTLYFQLMLVTLGLPVPSKMLKCSYPSQLAMLLKSSGNVKKGISSFGEELEFFCNAVEEGAFIFVDELFQTTNPQSGVQLSQLVLDSFKNYPAIFFATTHYPELIKQDDVGLYRMKEMQFAREIDRELSAKDLLGKMPFILEKITGDRQMAIANDQQAPLAVAAHFPLFQPLRQKVHATFLQQAGKNK